MMSLGERIKAARKSAGLTQERFADALGLTRGAVANWEKKKDPNNPETERLAQIAEVLGISTSWLLEAVDPNSAMLDNRRPRSGISDAEPERGTMDLSLGRPNASRAPLPAAPDRTNGIPVLGTAEAGKDGIFEFNGGTPIDFRDRPPALARRPQVYCIYVSGGSMEPAHRDGALLFIDAGRKPFPGRDALIELNPERDDDGQPLRAFVKRVVRITPDYVELLEFKPVERVFRLARERIRNLHLVLENSDLY